MMECRSRKLLAVHWNEFLLQKNITRYFAGRLHATLFDVRDEGASLVSGTSFKMKCLCEVSERVSEPAVPRPSAFKWEKTRNHPLSPERRRTKGLCAKLCLLFFLSLSRRRSHSPTLRLACLLGLLPFYWPSVRPSLPPSSVFPAPFHFPSHLRPQ